MRGLTFVGASQRLCDAGHCRDTGVMKILLTSSSRHGSTDEVASLVAERLRAAGLEVDVTRPELVDGVEGYDAFVLGSAIYMTHWTQEMTDFTQRFVAQLSTKPVWAFSVGLSGLPQGKVSDPHRIGPVLLSLDVENHVTFPGRFDPTRLSLRERTIARLGGASEGDYVDAKAVRAWADTICAELAPASA